MAGQAVAGICARVIKHRRSKVDGVMTNSTILVSGSGRYVIRQFTHTNHIVVAHITVSDNTGMVIGASAKGAKGMAVTTILVTGRTRIVRIGWHVRIEWCGKRFACGGNLRWYRVVIAMASLAVVHYTVMIETEGRREAFGVMTRSTIGVGEYVSGHGGRLGGCVNTGAIVVA